VAISRATTPKGHQAQVPNGSLLLGASNRRNPDRTSILGGFGWDVAPGYYQVQASHTGCTAARGNAKTVRSSVYAVPPPRLDLSLTLRCPHLRRQASRVRLVVIKQGAGSHELVATVFAARGGGSAATLVGEVTFTVGHRTITTILTDGRSQAEVLLPRLKGVGTRFAASYLGNGLFAPAISRSG
jgi:hypothetical protein